LHLYDLIL